ncbi:hypothetical protein ES703_42531 [subsurface metagenome]
MPLIVRLCSDHSVALANMLSTHRCAKLSVVGLIVIIVSFIRILVCEGPSYPPPLKQPWRNECYPRRYGGVIKLAHDRAPINQAIYLPGLPLHGTVVGR